MAFQRPFLISMKRGDSSHRWGFGITGGKEYGEPLQIQSVAEDSLAERFGLHEGDEVIQVGRVNVQDLTQGQVYELLARCGNKIEMFVIREDLFAPRKGKEPPVVKAVVHNPYNSPLQLYSTENVADTLARQTEVLVEGRVSPEEEDEGPESLSFKQKSAVFQLLEEQAKQETGQKQLSRGSPQRQTVVKPKAAPPPPPKPKPPAQEPLHNGYDASQRQVYQDQQQTRRVEYHTTQKQYLYQYQQEQPVQYQQTNNYQTSNYSPGYQSPGTNYQQRNYQEAYQQNTYQQPQSPRSPVVNNYQQHPGYQSPAATTYHPLNQVNYQQSQQQNREYQQSQQQNREYQQSQQQNREYQQAQQQNRGYQQTQQVRDYQQTQQQNKGYQQTQPREYQIKIQTANQQSEKEQKSPTAVSKAEFKIGPPPPPRGSSTKQQQDSDNMAAVYKQQYEQHLQQYELQQMYMNHFDDVGSPPKAHIIKDNIFEQNSISNTPITYQAPPVAPAKPNWPPPPTPEQFRSPAPSSPTGMRVTSAWPPKKSTVTELPKTGFNPASATGDGRKCIWPPPNQDEHRSGRNTPQSPVTGRRIVWNPSPSPPTTRKVLSPLRRKDIQWPPPSPTSMVNGKDTVVRGSPRLTRKARFDDYIKEHASVNVPQTYRPPPGTQHVEYR